MSWKSLWLSILIFFRYLHHQFTRYIWKIHIRYVLSSKKMKSISSREKKYKKCMKICSLIFKYEFRFRKWTGIYVKKRSMNMYVKCQTFYAKQCYNGCISILDPLSIAKVSHFFYELWPFLFKVEILLNLQCIKGFTVFSDFFHRKIIIWQYVHS